MMRMVCHMCLGLGFNRKRFLYPPQPGCCLKFRVAKAIGNRHLRFSSEANVYRTLRLQSEELFHSLNGFEMSFMRRATKTMFV